MLLNATVCEIENPLLQWITGLFWGTHEGSYFPFTSWIFYVAAGYLFADILQQTEDKKEQMNNEITITFFRLNASAAYPANGLAISDDIANAPEISPAMLILPQI